MSRHAAGLLAAAALLAVGGIVSGCGETAKALRANGPITKAEATTYAQEVNLGPADVPGMVSVSQEGENKEKPSHVAARCGAPQAKHVPHIVDIESPKFRSGGALDVKEVNSEVEVLSTATVANRKLANETADLHAGLGSARVRACLAGAYAQLFMKGANKRRGVRVAVGHVAFVALHPALPDSVGERFALPFTITGPARSVSTVLYVDVLGVVTGPAIIGLKAVSLAGTLPTEQRLLSLLYSRATGGGVHQRSSSQTPAPEAPSVVSPPTPSAATPPTPLTVSPALAQGEWVAHGRVSIARGGGALRSGEEIERVWLFQRECAHGRCAIYWTREVDGRLFTAKMTRGPGGSYSARFENETYGCVRAESNVIGAFGLLTSAFTVHLGPGPGRLTASERTYATTPACSAVKHIISWTATRSSNPS
jgi:hypothetical protein